MNEQDSNRHLGEGGAGPDANDAGSVAVRKAVAVHLVRAMPAGEAARSVLRECAAQISANAAAILSSDDPEGPHQLRIGLRRLRSALSIFGKVVDGEAREVLASEAKWLGREAGKVRDVDVILSEMVEPLARARPDDEGAAALAQSVQASASGLRTSFRTTISGPRASAFLRDLQVWVETAPWMTADDTGQAKWRGVPARDLAGMVLDKRWKKTRAHARKIGRLTLEQRHELRKELKKLRYAVEFLAPIHAQKKVAPFLAHLKSLQDVFGALNDTRMAETWFAGDPAGADADPAVQRAIGRLLGAKAMEAETAWSHARALWKDLKRTPVFWKKRT
ncbi:CHAD domain-containing protein [Zhengella sp. ZM62]|uniref:CHAD domain-containing protein n=1 Tax=Zhengella sedimenti TaxID=3390035 RepID=UPI003975F969